mmetsp:Transcript_20805/g.49214  ORF Transcript_20805/g.49214 Transcript_20805/m.49214 type:complete len:115 (+) Transcript_20805:57-401(+)
MLSQISAEMVVSDAKKRRVMRYDANGPPPSQHRAFRNESPKKIGTGRGGGGKKMLVGIEVNRRLASRQNLLESAFGDEEEAGEDSAAALEAAATAFAVVVTGAARAKDDDDDDE